jgi:hypothetical protein
MSQILAAYTGRAYFSPELQVQYGTGGQSVGGMRGLYSVVARKDLCLHFPTGKSRAGGSLIRIL